MPSMPPYRRDRPPLTNYSAVRPGMGVRKEARRRGRPSNGYPRKLRYRLMGDRFRIPTTQILRLLATGQPV